ncbi:MAG: NADH-quinone oxidoreductase subunit C [Wenzhouxiangellaceae bacterium]
MSESKPALSDQLREFFGDRISDISEHRGQLSATVTADHWLSVCRSLRDEADFHFEQLIDLCGVDYLSYGQDEWATSDEVTGVSFSRGVDALGPGRFSWKERPEAELAEQRFAAVIQLMSIRHNRRLRLRCFAPNEDLPVIPSLVDIWNVANWYEREAFDLFGIVFEGHPDLRRIMTDYGFVGHPFRKDFPLIGNVTAQYDAEKRRVVYVPTEIEPRVLVPRVVREDSRYQTDSVDKQAGAA